MNGEENERIILCPRCGEEMKESSRYCMKCGNLNYNHPENENMVQYGANVQHNYVVGEGKKLDTSASSSDTISFVVGSNMGNRKICFLVNIIICLFVVLLLFLIGLGSSGSITKIINSSFPISLVCASISFLYFYSIQIIYMKMNVPWWSSFIPIYNCFVLCSALYRKKLLAILFFIPIVNVIFSIYVLYTMSKKFKVSFILAILLPFIFIPYVAFSGSSFDGRLYIEPGEVTYEKQYKRNKTFLSINIILLFVGVGLFIYSNISNVSNIGGLYYKNAAERMVKKVKKKVESGDITCSVTDYDSEKGTYYFYFPSFYDEIYLPAFAGDIEGYVKIENNNGVSTYSISLTNGKVGVKETNIEKLKESSFGKYKSLDNSYNGYECSLN